MEIQKMKPSFKVALIALLVLAGLVILLFWYSRNSPVEYESHATFEVRPDTEAK